MEIKKDWKKYGLTFVITAAIFITAISISSWINNKRVDEVRSIQDSISLNILSSETQFNLLKEASCEDLFGSDIGQELGDLSDRLSYFESIGRGSDADVMTLKKYYSLLEIKDYLLTDSAAKCPSRPTTIIYFYKSGCDDCSKQGDVLTYIRQHSPGRLRIYSFDQDLDISAVKTLANIYKIKPPFPALVIKSRAYNGFKSIDDIDKLIPEVMVTASSTTKTTGATASTTKIKR